VLPDVNADPNVLPPCGAVHVHGPGCQGLIVIDSKRRSHEWRTTTPTDEDAT
jgi:hypothetical protein